MGGTLVPSAVEVMEGDLVTLQLDVRNVGGTKAVDIYVQFYLDGLPYAQPLYLSSLDPGEIQNLTTSWTANLTGFHELSVKVDSTGAVDETAEDNNGASVQVRVERPDYQTSPGPGLALALVAIATLALLATRRGRRGS
jgi:subtilase family serine protease